MSDGGSSSKKKGWPRGRKRNLKIKDVNAPKMPMSGYMLFLNDHRERVRAANPGATFSDMTRLLANAWQAADPGEKQRYMEAAQQERERYNQQLQQYQQTDSYRQFSQQLKAKTTAAKQSTRTDSGAETTQLASPVLQGPTVAPAAPVAAAGESDSFAFDVPIFTDGFLTYNREREAELRQLRRAVGEYEEQNAALQKHVDGVQEAVERLETEAGQQRGHNAALQDHLTRLRGALADRFCQLQLPDSDSAVVQQLPAPTPQNMDEFLNRLQSLIASEPQQHAKLAEQVRDIVLHLDCQ